MVEDVLQSTIWGAAQYSFSATGSLVYVPGGVQARAQRRLVWVNRNGAEQPLASPARAYRVPRLSPDGRRVAVEVTEQGTQVWLYDLSRETLTRFTFEGDGNFLPDWTPDGKRIAFTSNKEGPQNLFWQLADGSGGLERLTTSEFGHWPMSWSPDGQLLAFYEGNPTTAAGHLGAAAERPQSTAFPPNTVRRRGGAVFPRRSLDGLWLERIGAL